MASGKANAGSSGADSSVTKSSQKRSRQQTHQIGLDVEKEISQIGYMLDNTTKTRAIFEISKGTNKDPRITDSLCAVSRP